MTTGRRDIPAEIKGRISIVDVVGAAVTLKKKGQRHMGLCPFHGEKTPSFSVNEDKGLFYCFGCQAGGDMFEFVKRYEGLDFKGALRRLAEQAGVSMRPESAADKKRQSEESKGRRVLLRCQAYFLEHFKKELGARAHDYLRGRRVDPKIAQEFGLGYGGPRGGLLRILREEKFSDEDLGLAGILSDDGQKVLFDERLTIPVRDERGKLVGFGGRRLDAEKMAKYVNSRESVLFKKSNLLFALDLASPALRVEKKAVLCEGFMDVLACYQAGQKNAVAALGTAFTPNHAALLARFVGDVVVLYDGDAAGRAAALKTSTTLAIGKLRASWAPLPSHEDPASIVESQGNQALLDIVLAAKPAVDALMDVMLTGVDGVAEKTDAASSLWPLIHHQPTGLERDLYRARLAERLGLPAETLEAHLKDLIKPKVTKKKKGAEDYRSEHQRPEPPPPMDEDGPPRDWHQGFEDEQGWNAGPPPDHREERSASAPVFESSRAPLDWLDFEREVLAQLLLYPEQRKAWGELGDFVETEALGDFFDAAAAQDNFDLAELMAEFDFPQTWRRRFMKILPASRSADPNDDLEALAQKTLSDALSALKRFFLERDIQKMRLRLKNEVMEEAEALAILGRIKKMNQKKLAL